MITPEEEEAATRGILKGKPDATPEEIAYFLKQVEQKLVRSPEEKRALVQKHLETCTEAHLGMCKHIKIRKTTSQKG